MGRDWSWLGGGGRKKSLSRPKKDKKTMPVTSPVGKTTTVAGCMSAVFNIFDFHHLQFPINHHPLHIPKGVEASRNSLESTVGEEEIPFSQMGIKIKTKPQARTSTSSSVTATESYSPSIKTPTLVARLMGLDLVPTSSSSSFTDLKTPTRSSQRHYSLQRNSIDGGTRSLPETPRISLGRRSVDVNCYSHQRSSFHLRDNNNNINTKSNKLHEDKENRSPREYARQIVKQLKENVSQRRRMGTDITNSRSNKEHQSSEIHESKKASKITIITHDSSSQRLGSLQEMKTKVQDKTKLPTVQEEAQRSEQEHQRREETEKQRKSVKKCKKTESFKSRLVKPPQTMQEELLVRSPETSKSNNKGLVLKQGDKSSWKKSPLSINDDIKKKDSSPHNKSSNFHVDETQLPRNRATEFPCFPNQSQTHIVPIAGDELEYITRILRRTGIEIHTPISNAKWLSPSHPLDPSIFYFLEHFPVTSEDLALRCNRKLLFHLVDEILADFSKPWLCHFPIQSRRTLNGSELIDEICQIIERFPSAKGLVLEDIDTLVTGDIPETASEEEVITEIERGILESIVTETMIDYATWSHPRLSYT